MADSITTAVVADVEVSPEALSSQTCALFPEEPGRCIVLANIRLIISIISLIGACFMIFLIWLFRKYEEFRQRLILYLSISSALSSLTYLLSYGSSDGHKSLRCTTEAFFSTYADWSVLLWILCITFNLLFQVQKLVNRRIETTNSRDAADKTELIYMAVGWCIPMGIAAIPLMADVYGPAGQWCWIKAEAHSWRLFTWYLWNAIAMILLFAIYGYIRYQLKFLSENAYMGAFEPGFVRQKRAMEQDRRTLQAYPIVYAITSIFPICLRLHNFFSGSVADSAPFTLWIMVTIMVPLQGAVNSIVFGLDPETRQRLTKKHFRLAWWSHWDNPLIERYPIHRFKPTDSDVEERTGLLSRES